VANTVRAFVARLLRDLGSRRSTWNSARPDPAEIDELIAEENPS
jgi:hypothetical protein